MKLYRNLDVNLWVTNISNSVPSLLCPNDDSPSFIPFTESAVARGNLWSFADMKQSMTGDTQARETRKMSKQIKGEYFFIPKLQIPIYIIQVFNNNSMMTLFYLSNLTKESPRTV